MRELYVEPCRDPKSVEGECRRRSVAGDALYECRNKCKYIPKEGVDTATEEEYGDEVKQVPNDQELGRETQ